MCISGTVSHTDDVLAFFHNISCFVFTVSTHICRVISQMQGLFFSRFQLIGFSVRCQFLVSFLHLTVRCGEINLYYFFSGNITGVCYRNIYTYLIGIDADIFYIDIKIRIRKSVTKLISYIFSKRIKVTITNVNTIAVIFGCCVSVQSCIGRSIIINVFCPGKVQFTGWIYGTVQQIDAGCSGTLSSKSDIKYRIDIVDVIDPGNINNLCIQYYDHFFEFFCDLFDVLTFNIREIIVTFFRFTVTTFSAVSCQYVNCCIGVLFCFFNPLIGKFYIICHFASGKSGCYDTSSDRFTVSFRCGNVISGSFHCCVDPVTFSLVYNTGTGSAFYGTGCTISEKCHIFQFV